MGYHQHSRGHWALLGTICLAFALRLYRLDSKSLWVDEGYTSWVVSLDPSALLQAIATTDNHPPLHYLVLHLWTGLIGDSDFSLRFPSLLAGVLAIPLAAQLGRWLFGERVGLVAAALLAVSPFHIWYSQEARMYAFLALGTLLSLSFLLKATAEARVAQPRWPWWLGYALASAFTALSHYYGLLILAVGLALVLLATRPRRLLAPWLMAQLGVGLLFLPWLPSLLSQYRRAPHHYQLPLDLFETIRSLASTFSIGEWVKPSPLWVAFPLLALMGIVPTKTPAGRWGGRSLLTTLAWLLLPLLLAHSLSLVSGLDLRATGTIYYLGLLPAFYLLVARGLAMLSRLHVLLIAPALAGLLLLSFSSLDEQFHRMFKEDFRGAAGYIEDHEGSADAILLHAEHIFPAFAHYYRGGLSWHRALPGRADIAQQMEELSRKHQRLWLVLSHEQVSDPEGNVMAWFGQNALPLKERYLDGVAVFLYSLQPRPNPVPPKPTHALPASFAHRLALLGYDLDQPEVGAPRLLVALHWQALTAIDRDYRFKLRLEDDRGRSWAQADQAPLSGAYPTSRWQPGEYVSTSMELSLPPGTPPGKYQLELELYASNGERLIASRGEESPIATTWLPLGSLELKPLPTLSLKEALASVERPLEVSFPPGGHLLGANLGPRQALPGGSLSLELLWRARGNAPSLESELRLIDAADNLVLRQSLAADLELYPPSRWQPNELVRTKHELTLPGSLKAGHYQVQIAAISMTSGKETASALLGAIEVVEPQRVFTLPIPQRKRRDDLGGLVSLLGYDLSPRRLPPGQGFTLTLYWQAKTTPAQNYAIFTHLLNRQGRMVAGHDGVPASGTRPTSGWVEAEVIRDEHLITVPSDLEPGSYRLEVGMYRAETGERLEVMAGPDLGQDRILLEDEIIISAPAR